MNLKAAVLSLVVLVLPSEPAAAGVVWSGEFNGAVMDPDTWTYDVGGHGFGNGPSGPNAIWSNLGGSIAGNVATNAGGDPFGPPRNVCPVLSIQRPKTVAARLKLFLSAQAPPLPTALSFAQVRSSGDDGSFAGVKPPRGSAPHSHAGHAVMLRLQP